VVDRIEVLKDGASAIYGSDAIAGVINFITRKDFSGGEILGYAPMRRSPARTTPPYSSHLSRLRQTFFGFVGWSLASDGHSAGIPAVTATRLTRPFATKRLRAGLSLNVTEPIALRCALAEVARSETSKIATGANRPSERNSDV